MNLTYAQLTTWPGHLRTDDERHASPFQNGTTYAATLGELDREVDQLANGGYHHTDAILQIACASSSVRRDGRLADRSIVVDHPGVVLSFPMADGTPMQFWCDTFGWHYGEMTAWQANVRAIALGLHDLRRVSRYGLNSGNDQYVGFTAIGSGRPMGASTEHELTYDEAAAFVAGAADIGTAYVLEVLGDTEGPNRWRRVYGTAARRCHPDSGGSEELFKKLQAAVKVLKPPE